MTSPAFKPCTAVISPSVVPTETFCIATVWSGLTRYTKGALSVALNGHCRDQGGVMLRFNQKSRVHELVWEKSVFFVGKLRPELDGTGGWVNLIIDGQKVSSTEPVLQRAVIRFDGQPNPMLELVDHRRNGVLGDSKDNRNRLELGDHNQASGVSRLNEVPRIHQAQPDAPADRRGDAGVDKLHFDTFDQSLIVLNGAFELAHKGYLRIVLLPWN
jgi:hypothetical protein